MAGTKKPVSVLVVIHDPELNILLLERAAHPGYWQSVTGSQEADESLSATAVREVGEETGIIIVPSRSQNWLAAPHREADTSMGRPDGGTVCTANDLVDWRLANRFEIFAEWRDRYPAGVTHNTEHVFRLCVPEKTPVIIAPGEHRAYRWLPWREAAAACFSWTNRDAILMLGLSVRQ
jgi:dATP pyrophosphohydrolase